MSGEQVGGWFTDGFVWLIWAAAWFVGALAALAAVLSTGVLLGCAGVALIERRHARREQGAARYRDWCEANHWCPVHHVEDGRCPRVEQVTPYHNPSRWFAECEGSAALRSRPVDPVPIPDVPPRNYW